MKTRGLMIEIRNKYKNDSLTSRQLGISRQAIINICNGISIPKNETVEAMAKELNLDEAKLLIQANIERSKGHSKKVWEKIAKKYESVAASILAVAALSPFLTSMQCILC